MRRLKQWVFITLFPDKANTLALYKHALTRISGTHPSFYGSKVLANAPMQPEAMAKLALELSEV